MSLRKFPSESSNVTTLPHGYSPISPTNFTPLSRSRLTSARMSVVLNQDGALRGRLAVGRIEPDAETSHVHGAPVGALLRHRQIQHISVERDGAFHVLDFVVDVLNARNHRTNLRGGRIGVVRDSPYVGAG